MLIDLKSFQGIELVLKENGEIKKFEEENGKILGRVMITLGDIPQELKEEVLKDSEEEDLYIFNCSFDFYNSVLGIALNKENLELVSGLWITEQKEGAEKPAQDWIDFFVRMIVENVIENKNGLGLPIYIFVNNDSEMVIVPTI